MGRGLSALSVCTFSKIVESNSDDRDEAVVGGKKINKDEKYKNLERSHQVGSGFSLTAFSHNASLVAFNGRPYKLTCLGSTRL